MDLTPSDVSKVIEAVQTGALTRDAAENWATERMDALDREDLAFVPGTEEHRLWDALIFLAGVGLEVEPGRYLHTDADLEAFRARTGF